MKECAYWTGEHLDASGLTFLPAQTASTDKKSLCSVSEGGVITPWLSQKEMAALNIIIFHQKALLR